MRRLIWGALVIALLAGIATAFHARRPRLPAAERGRRLAEAMGCFGCHGPGGLQGASNPGRSDKTVPGFGGDLMMYAKTPDEIAEWIRDGVTAKRRASASWREQRAKGALRMPAFGDRLSPTQVRDLVAMVRAVNGDPEPGDSLSAAGLDRAEALGCTGCHGAGGRFARPNPGSFKGYIPSWDGEDFPELVRDRAEFGEWVERGISRRLERQPLAVAFLRRAAVIMPAYRDHLMPGDPDALWAYVRGLRADTTAAR